MIRDRRRDTRTRDVMMIVCVRYRLGVDGYRTSFLRTAKEGIALEAQETEAQIQEGKG